VLKYFRGVEPFDLIQDAPIDADDVRLYSDERLTVLDDERRTRLADRISQAAEGNFLYAHLVLNDLLSRLPGITDLAEIPLPKGLSGLCGTPPLEEVGGVSQSVTSTSYTHQTTENRSAIGRL
jgi:hypothetical protein